jgi:AMP-activated protein kinase-like protein
VPLPAQLVRTRDAGIAAVSYENGTSHTAATLTDALIVERPRSTTLATGFLSIFEDGAWTAQGTLSGTRFSQPLTIAPALAPFFKSVRGESSLALNATAQQRAQPTMQLIGSVRAHFLDIARGVWFAGTVSRAFDGRRWLTALSGEGAGWIRHEATVLTATVRPMQLQNGDLLTDNEVEASWARGRATFGLSSGIRVGQALRGTTAWTALNVTFPIKGRYLTTASIGSYPADLMQTLPGGRFFSITVRLPSREVARSREGTRPSILLGAGGDPSRDAAGNLVFFYDTPKTTTDLRVVRLRAPGALRVEIMGDFTGWEPVTMVRERTGEWVTTVHFPAGAHRVNVRIDGGAWQVPANLARVTDEFNGVVGVFIVP